MKMRSLMPCGLLALGVVLNAQALASDALGSALAGLRIEPLTPPVPAPDFQLQDDAGRSVRLHAASGGPALLNFWATFCGPCRAEMPALQAMHTQYGPQGLRVVAVAMDDGRRSARQRFIAQLGLDFALPVDQDGQLARLWEVSSLPVTYVLDGQGRIVGRALGERDWSSAQAQALAEALLGQPSVVAD